MKTLKTLNLTSDKAWKNLATSGIVIGTWLIGTPVHAGIKETVISKTTPIVELIQALGYPVCLSAMTVGAVMMAFNRKKGIALIRDGAIAYIVIQFVPAIMQMLSGIGSATK